MGGSRRRLKRHAPKVKVGVQKRKRNERTSIPVDITEQQPHLRKRLKQTAEWCPADTLAENYERNRLVLDANKRIGRVDTVTSLVPPEERQAAGQETYSDDDELRAACNLQRKTGAAPPPRLTSHQRQIITRLIAAHGENCKAMSLDTKLNKMQHSEGHLKKLIEGFHFWKEGSKHDFRAPNKPTRL